MRFYCRFFTLFLSLLFFCHADELFDRIKNFVGDDTYRVNEKFIEKIFQNQQDFFKDGKIDHKKILENLKANGLLNLRFDSPKEVNLIFSSETSPIFLLRSINDVLASMGYSYFEVKKAEYNNSLSSIVSGLNSEYMVDPLIIIDEMNKRGYVFMDIKRIDEQTWQYDVSLIDSRLSNAKTIEVGDNIDLKEVSGEYWLQISDVSVNMEVKAQSVEWRPKIVFFDKNLHIIDILKKQSISKSIAFNVTKGVRFILVSDLRNPVILKAGIHLTVKSL